MSGGGVFLCATLVVLAAPRPDPQEKSESVKPESSIMKPLSAEEKRVILNKGTERPYTGKYWDHYARGIYHCRNCGLPLYTSKAKFKSDCGWPSFDDELPGAVKRSPDADGIRTEITCAGCGGHLGHVFLGEGFTPKNTRHCVNSVSIVFRSIPEQENLQEAAEEASTSQAIFAGGCFWGVEHLMEQLPGVKEVTSGYTGGLVEDPTYEQVTSGMTGHSEAVEVVFDPKEVDYETLARRFFEIHDPTQVNRQGPDVGSQYRSVVYYTNDHQRKVAIELIGILRKKGYQVATHVLPASEFYPAEEYHQDFIKKHPERPCHRPVKRFD